MSRQRRILNAFLGGIGFVIALLVLAYFSIPFFINLDAVRDRIQSAASRQIGGQVEIEKIDVLLFPRLAARIYQTKILVPGRGEGTIKSLTVYPAILPLLTGTVRIARLQAEDPEFTIMLPPESGEEAAKGGPATLESLESAVFGGVAALAAKMSELVAEIDNGKLIISREGRNLFSFSHIRARIALPHRNFTFSLASDSDLWESIAVEGNLNAEKFKGTGSVVITKFQAGTLVAYLFPRSSRTDTNMISDLNARFTIDGPAALDAEGKASIPLVTLPRGNNRTVIRGISAECSFHQKGQETVATIESLIVGSPRLSLSGKLVMDRAIPQYSIDVRGTDIDVPALRKTALAAAGDISFVKPLFSILKGGTVPVMTFDSRGSSPADLGNLKNIVIAGTLRDGAISTPGASLDLQGVSAQVSIADGLLSGKEISARLGGTKAANGTLELGLQGDDAPFHLETMVDADMSQLPPILLRLVKDEGLKEEISRVHDLTGRAKGMLILGERMAEIIPRVSIQDFQLTALYERIPYPVKITRGGFSYDRTAVAVNGMTGSVGSSSFSGVNARLTLDTKYHLEVAAGPHSLALAELYPWLTSFDSLKSMQQEVESLRGTIDLSALEMKGPLLRPDDWKFKVSGGVRDVVVDSTLLPGAVTMQSGKFEVLPEKISFADIRADILDSSMQATGSVTGYRTGIDKIEATFQGEVGMDSLNRLSDEFGMPPGIRFRAPMEIKKGHLEWGRSGEASFQGMLAFHQGPDVSLDLHRNPGVLDVRSLFIQDGESRALLSFSHSSEEISTSFHGKLTEATLDSFLSGITSGSGWIKGDFELRIMRTKPMESTASGDFEGENFDIYLAPEVPVKLRKFSLAAEGNTVMVNRFDLVLGDRTYSLEGVAGISKDEFEFDIDAQSDGIEVDTIIEVLSRIKKGPTETGRFWDLPLGGIVRLDADYLRYGRYIVAPFYADISLEPDDVTASVINSRFCGIFLEGDLTITPRDINLDFFPFSQEQDLNSTFACIIERGEPATGRFDLKGELRAEGKSEDLARSLRGNVDFVSRDGRIYEGAFLAKILNFLNITEIFFGKMPDMKKQGFGYHSITVKGPIKQGTLILEKAVMDGSSLGLAAEGDYDLVKQKVDLDVLASPLRTVDRIVRNIPLVGSILGGTLVALPMKVKGDVGNPEISYFSPSAIGSRLLGIMKNIMKLPLKLIKPLIPEEKEKSSQ